MKKVLLLFALFVISSVSFAVSPKWAKMENWRKMKSGLPEQAVIKLLGKPSYEKVGSLSKSWFYTDKEPQITDEGYVIPQYASVGFGRKANNRRIFIVIDFKEPDFEEVRNIQIQKPEKETKKNAKKQIRKSQKWEVEKNWKRLREGMTEAVVKRALGEPTKQEQGRSGMTLHYGPDKIYGVSVKLGLAKKRRPDYDTRKKYVLEHWSEPFWYLVKKDLCGELPKKKSDEQSKTSSDEDTGMMMMMPE